MRRKQSILKTSMLPPGYIYTYNICVFNTLIIDIIYIQHVRWLEGYNHMALASLSICLSDPSTWNEMMSLDDPMYLPPTKTAGTAGFDEPSERRARSISRPSGSLSSSWIAGLAPSSQNNVLMLWHIQHELFVNITAAFFDDKSLILSNCD